MQCIKIPKLNYNLGALMGCLKEDFITKNCLTK